jgi:hypothetical protein
MPKKASLGKIAPQSGRWSRDDERHRSVHIPCAIRKVIINRYDQNSRLDARALSILCPSQLDLSA